ncbi:MULTISPECIES: DUF3515 domain-containing protein [Streptomyces]|uniref:DUF3515 domain-containing protein n=1 Tax=Streptomyces TaxID=1883 RepID=UPI0001D05DDB|nr:MULTISPECIES: DUF3515 domain-containing protein [Streptomyces]MYX31611.1 DUF3515 family protein [Streptomyces sp. SID8381]MYX42969.1 DUF3515 family protein [Streptomyces sp. SID89]NED33393.1 DUF3515 domain-containing protein [Streptomyces sp. SID8499]EFF93288.1 conserved hypothetical protein [Streptomyces sp. e14]MBY8867581.1 DUF3515 domain-containing protein [Streptomyces sennicomposti]
MSSSRHRLYGLPALAVLIAAAGCSSSDDSAAAAVPSPDAAAVKLCRDLDGALPGKLAGLSRKDPRPASALTAGWGSPVIILRCGVPRPPKMIDPKVAEGKDPDAVAGGVNGVDWLMERQGDGGYRFTTANRRAYVEVVVPEGRDSSTVLVGLAPAIKKAIPEGIAD